MPCTSRLLVVSIDNMSRIVITIVGSSIPPSLEAQAAKTVRDAGAEIVTINMLDRARAIDILVEGDNPALITALRARFSNFGPYDIFVQQDNVSRRKKLLLADMDATIVTQETLDELAGLAGVKEKVAPITEKAMRGEIDFAEALAMRVALLKGFPLQKVHALAGKVSFSPGATALVATMRRFDARCVLVSGGFDIFTESVAQSLGFHAHHANRLATDGATLLGNIIPPILDKEAKARILTEEAAKLLCPLEFVMAVGDGANDIPMLEKAGTGVGYFAKPAVLAATPHQIRHTNLSALLYMQGYTEKEIAVAK